MAYLTISDPAIADLGLDATIAQSLVDTASEIIDSICHRSFTPIAQPEARVFVANRGEALTDDVLDWDNATVEIQPTKGGDWETIESPEWTPFNGTPKQRLVGLATGRYPVRVTGTFGYDVTVPERVKMAVRILAVRMADRTRQAYATRRETIGEYGITYATPEDVDKHTLEAVEKLLIYGSLVKYRFGTLEGD